MSTRISFEYKCSQRCQTLQQQDGNKFCQLCSTTVHDLTDKSREEIQELLLKNNNRLCGHFYSDQLQEPAPHKRTINPKLFLAGIAALVSLNTFRLSAQTTAPPPTEQHESTKPLSPLNDDLQAKNIISDEERNKEVSRQYRDKKYKRRHGITLLRIGATRFFLSARFPFFHIRRMVMGKMAAFF